MTDLRQASHFNDEAHRYAEHLLFNPPQHTRDEISVILSILKRKNIKTVVELGSGNGRLTFPLLHESVRVTAVDISRDSLQALLRVAKKMKIPQGLLSTSQTIPHGNNKAIVGCDILHHVPLDTYLKDMHENLVKPRGTIVFSEPNILNIFWPIYITFFINWEIEGGIRNCNFFTISKKLHTQGFQKINIQGFGLFPLPLFNAIPFLQRINYFLGSLPVLKLFAYRLIITAEAH